jgi:LCP family protein required for cell wall assembly
MTREIRTGDHAVVGAALSMVLPGAGQAYAGRPYRAAAFLGGILVVAFAVWSWLMWTADPLATLIEPSALAWVLALDLALLVYRSWAVVDAYRLKGPTNIRGKAALLVILAITAVPHLALAYADVHLSRVVEGMFTAPETDEVTPSEASPPPSIPAVAGPPGTDQARTGPTTTTATATPIPATPATSTPGAPSSGTFQPVSVLLLGGDAGPGRPGLRTDVIDVVTFIPATGRAALFGIPRNFGSVPLPDTLAGRYRGGVFPRLINGLHGAIEADPGPYAGSVNAGAEALEDTIGLLLGIDIEYHALVDMGGFVDVIDALGGVTIDVPTPVVDRLSPPKEGEDFREYVIPAGVQHLDGHQALAYVRSRTASNDYDRMARQRCVLAALTDQVGALDLFTAVPRLATALESNVSTDVPIDLLPALIRVAANIESSNVITVRFVPPEYTVGTGPGGQLIPDTALIRDAVQATLDGLGDQGLAAGATVGTACAWDG